MSLEGLISIVVRAHAQKIGKYSIMQGHGDFKMYSKFNEKHQMISCKMFDMTVSDIRNVIITVRCFCNY